MYSMTGGRDRLRQPFEAARAEGDGVGSGKVAHFQVGLKIGFRYEGKHGSP
jgi:flavin-binding protein dodecin